MLAVEQCEVRYERPAFAEPKGKPSAGQAALPLTPVANFRQPVSEPDVGRLRDSEEAGIETDLTPLVERRDELAYRKLRGEALSPRESLALAVLNDFVRRTLIPRSSPLPESVREAMEEVRFMRRR